MASLDRASLDSVIFTLDDVVVEEYQTNFHNVSRRGRFVVYQGDGVSIYVPRGDLPKQPPTKMRVIIAYET
jgi:hypothetical protein